MDETLERSWYAISLSHLCHAGNVNAKVLEMLRQVWVLHHIILIIGVDIPSVRSDGPQFHSQRVLGLLVVLHGMVVATGPYSSPTLTVLCYW